MYIVDYTISTKKIKSTEFLSRHSNTPSDPIARTCYHEKIAKHIQKSSRLKKFLKVQTLQENTSVEVSVLKDMAGIL